MLCKIAVADEAPALIRLAISFFGGHGIMEDFIALPRFHRDSMIMELWEGPRNVLLAQIHRDLQRVAEWYSAEDFIKDVLEGAEKSIIEPLAKKFARIISHDTLLRSDEITLNICKDWQELSTEIVRVYQEQALVELDYEEKPIKFSKLYRKFKKRLTERKEEELLIPI
jgi:ATP-dependent RNA circularization protein (DNA/RNA ligase family)